MNEYRLSLFCLFLLGVLSVVGMIRSEIWPLQMIVGILFFGIIWFTRCTRDREFFTLCSGTALVFAIGQSNLLIATCIQALLLCLLLIMTWPYARGEIRMFFLLCLPLFAFLALLGVLAGHMSVPLLALIGGCAVAFVYVRFWEYQLSNSIGGNG
jgi:xanthosine utilization system XapX-like protein